MGIFERRQRGSPDIFSVTGKLEPPIFFEIIGRRAGGVIRQIGQSRFPSVRAGQALSVSTQRVPTRDRVSRPYRTTRDESSRGPSQRQF